MSAIIDKIRFPILSSRGRGILTGVLVAIAAVAIAASSVASATISNSAPADSTLFGPLGADLLRGRWDSIFANPIVQAGPLELALWGVAELLGVTGPVGWAVFGIVVASASVIALALVVERMLRESAAGWSVPLAAASAALLALTGAPVMSIASGHPAQLAIPLLWLCAARLARAERPFAAAVVLGLTAGWEVWGLLGVPVLLLAPRIDLRTVWRSALGVALVLTVMFVPFAVLGPFRMFGFAWPIYDRTLAHLIWPDAATFAWPLRLAQGALSVGAGAVVALVTRRTVDGIWLVPLAVCSIRLLTDPVLAGYYSVAPVLLVVVGLALSTAQRSVVVLVACLVLLNLLIDFLPMTALVAAALVLLVVATVVAATTHSHRAPPEGRRTQQAQKKSGLGVEA